MIYTPMTKKALCIAYKAHEGQVDKTGVPYIFHPFHLAESMTDENSTIVALLHDVIEDTDWTIDDLEKEGFNEDILTALKLMTHNPAEPYMDYISRLSTCPVARQVKLADLYHNSDRTRVENPDEKMLKRWEKYDRAIQLLKSVNIH
ncbi:HD domain-containing protein [Frisingicoccus sp.]|uniref:HD domain-containing protein n=1 Tax=Frisingicoccus sp. TaxID=1918627 RepID=UPI002615E40A|nr:HD domain-containing protein [Frisingicoccus sp.]MDD6232118.1 HD domain-containing protein [Frisingicoccus sp.]MDY4834029.1 HD domain-containing protein [Frisingicoccus sp.]